MPDEAAQHRRPFDAPTSTDLSQAAIAELLKALTSGPIGDAILGLARGEMQIVAHPYWPDDARGVHYVISIESKPNGK
jgi:hypothetical protein